MIFYFSHFQIVTVLGKYSKFCVCMSQISFPTMKTMLALEYSQVWVCKTTYFLVSKSVNTHCNHWTHWLEYFWNETYQYKLKICKKIKKMLKVNSMVLKQFEKAIFNSLILKAWNKGPDVLVIFLLIVHYVADFWFWFFSMYKTETANRAETAAWK